MFKGITLLKNRLWRAENSVGGLRATLSERKCLGKPKGARARVLNQLGYKPQKKIFPQFICTQSTDSLVLI